MDARADDMRSARENAPPASPVRYFTAVAASAALVLAAFGIVNYRIDPLQFHRRATRFAPQFSFEQRFQNPGLARNYDYDTVIIGSSVTENFYPDEVEARLGGRALKLSISGSTAHEQALILDVAFRHRAPRNVIWALDWFAFATEPDAVRDDRGPFPDYLYRPGLRTIRGYLLNWDTFTHSLTTMRADAPLRDLASLNAWDEERPADCFELVRLYHDPEALRSKQRIMARLAHGAEAVRPNAEANFFRIVEAHPETTFYAYFPPYSVAHHRYYARHFPREYAALEVLRRLVAGRSPDLPNLRLYDFQAATDWTHDFDEYADITHHSRRINGYILDAFTTGRYRVESPGQLADLRAETAAFRAPITPKLCGEETTTARSHVARLPQPAR